MESSYHEHRLTTWYLWKEGIKLSDIHRKLSAICGEKVPILSTVFNWVQSFNRGKETTQAVVLQNP